MRVLHVINSLATGGAEKLVLDTLPLYNARGITTNLLLLNGSEHPFLSQMRSKANIEFSTLGNGSVYNPFHSVKLIKHLRKYDVVHVHLFPALYWVAMAKMIGFCKTKLVFTEHNTSNRRRGKLFRIIDRLMYSRYAKIITIAPEVDANIKAHLGFKSGRFQIILNGINLETIKSATPLDRTVLQIPETHKIIVQVSSFTKQKDQPTLIRAMQHLTTPTRLLLVGEGVLKEECMVLAKNLKIEDRVTFLGIRMDVPNLLKTGDVVVLSSRFEGLSLSSLEAMAANRPFVASDVPGLSEIVKNAGILFEAGNDKQLANILENLLLDTKYAQEVAHKCTRRASDYDINKMIDQHIALYSEICRSQS